MQFVVRFADGEVVEGRDILSPEITTKGTGWRDLPDKPVFSLSLVNQHGDVLKLLGYEAYNFFVESLQVLGQEALIQAVYLMGARGRTVTSYKVKLLRTSPIDPYQAGDITARVIERGKEYLGTETTGWRRGNDTRT